MIELIAKCLNTRSLYVRAIPALRNVRYNHGDAAAIERAENDLDRAEAVLQQAHAAKIRVDLLSTDLAVREASATLVKELNGQRQRAASVIAWSRNPSGKSGASPDPQGIARHQVGLVAQEKLMSAARDLVATSTDVA